MTISSGTLIERSKLKLVCSLIVVLGVCVLTLFYDYNKPNAKFPYSGTWRGLDPATGSFTAITFEEDGSCNWKLSQEGRAVWPCSYRMRGNTALVTGTFGQPGGGQAVAVYEATPQDDGETIAWVVIELRTRASRSFFALWKRWPLPSTTESSLKRTF